MSEINSQILTDLLSDRLASEYDINPSLLHDSTAATIIDNLVNELNKANNKVDAVNAEMLDTNSKLAKGIKVAEAVRDALKDDSEPDYSGGTASSQFAPMEMPDIPAPTDTGVMPAPVDTGAAPAMMSQEPTAPMPEGTPVNPNVLEGVGGGY